MESPLVPSVAILKPAEFGKDELSKFLDIAQSNTYANFIDKKIEFQKLVDLDCVFRNLVKNISQQDDAIFGLLLMRGHSSYLNAVRLVMAGSVVDTFVLLRAVLESALYGLHIDANEDLWKVWLNRHQSDGDLRKCKSEFTYAKVKATLTKKSPLLAQKIDSLYETTIDFGAHPNERAITSTTRLTKTVEKISFQTDYLAGDALSAKHALKVTLQVGVSSLSVFEKMRKQRFEILGISEILSRVKIGL